MSYKATIPVRFRDLDKLGHVNNAVYATYLGEASSQYYDAVVGGTAAHQETPLVHLEIDYRCPIEGTDEVEVRVSVTDLGDTSITMEYEIYTDATLAATGRTVQVLFDSESESTVSVPDRWRESITRFEDADLT